MLKYWGKASFPRDLRLSSVSISSCTTTLFLVSLPLFLILFVICMDNEAFILDFSTSGRSVLACVVAKRVVLVELWLCHFAHTKKCVVKKRSEVTNQFLKTKDTKRSSSKDVRNKREKQSMSQNRVYNHPTKITHLLRYKINRFPGSWA